MSTETDLSEQELASLLTYALIPWCEKWRIRIADGERAAVSIASAFNKMCLRVTREESK